MRKSAKNPYRIKAKQGDVMSIKSSTLKPKRQMRVFSPNAPQTKEVFLAGNFNDWKAEKHPLKKDDDGVLKKNTFLFPGTYEYKFFVDGHWELDPDNPQVCVNPFGAHNNVITISAK